MVIFLHVSVGCLISFDGILEFGVCAHLEGHTTLTSVSRWDMRPPCGKQNEVFFVFRCVKQSVYLSSLRPDRWKGLLLISWGETNRVHSFLHRKMRGKSVFLVKSYLFPRWCKFRLPVRARTPGANLEMLSSICHGFSVRKLFWKLGRSHVSPNEWFT